jgi:hypothetical protein
MSLAMAIVPLARGGKISPSAVQADFKQTFPTLPPLGKPEKGEGTLSFKLGDSDVIMGLMPAPVPWSDLEPACKTSWMWPDAAKVLRPHTQHLIVTFMDDGPPLAQFQKLSCVVASLLHTCPAALGVLWGKAGHLVSGKVFREFCVQMLPDGYPLYIWIDFQVGPGPEGRTAGYTRGLDALGLMDLETVNSPEPPRELGDRFFALALYLIENGLVIQDGDTVGEDEHERIKVSHTESVFGNEGEVLRLDYGAVKGVSSSPRRR